MRVLGSIAIRVLRTGWQSADSAWFTHEIHHSLKRRRGWLPPAAALTGSSSSPVRDDRNGPTSIERDVIVWSGGHIEPNFMMCNDGHMSQAKGTSP